MIFSLILVFHKILYFPQMRKTQKYDIYVELFYENVVFHAMLQWKKSSATRKVNNLSHKGT